MNTRRRIVSILAVLGLVVVAAVTALVISQHRAESTPSVVDQVPAEATASAMSGVQASYVGFDDLASLSAEATTIAKGKVLAERTERLNISEGVDRKANPTFVDCVVVDFRVQKAIKGTIRKNDVIRIAYLAGEDVPGLTNNASSIVFLTGTEAGPYMPLNPSQAIVRIENGKVRSNEGSLVEDGIDEEDVVAQFVK